MRGCGAERFASGDDSCCRRAGDSDTVSCEMGSAAALVVGAIDVRSADYRDWFHRDWIFISDVGAAVHDGYAHSDFHQPRAGVCGDYGEDCGARTTGRTRAFRRRADFAGNCAGGAERRGTNCAGVARAGGFGRDVTVASERTVSAPAACEISRRRARAFWGGADSWIRTRRYALRELA